MEAVELDPEVMGWLLDFIRERKRVTIDDIRREFFPDEIGTPYLYLDRLTEDGQLLFVPSEKDQASWIVGAKEEPKYPEHADCSHPETYKSRMECRIARVKCDKARNRYRLSQEKRFPEESE
jgi:hypothetical protein